MGGGAWPFLVRGVVRLVNSDNERDLNRLTSSINLQKLSFSEEAIVLEMHFGVSLVF